MQNQLYMDYKEYSGPIINITKEMKNDNKIPMSTEQIMSAFLDDLDKKTDIVYSLLKDAYLNSGDSFFIHPKGKLKVVRNSEFIRNFDAEFERHNSFQLGKTVEESLEIYNKAEGPEFSLDYLEKNVMKLSPEKAIQNVIWQNLVPDKQILKDFSKEYSKVVKRNSIFNLYLSEPSNIKLDPMTKMMFSCIDKMSLAFHNATNYKMQNILNKIEPELGTPAYGSIASLNNVSNNITVFKDSIMDSSYARMIGIPKKNL